MAGMYKNQLQELAQRSCFNLPSYACIREGPDHAPRFKASVNFNGEIFEGPSYCTTLRQAEHAAAEAALSTLSTRGPTRSLAARVLDETGVFKNLLQETAHRAGLNLPVYTTVRSGPGHLPVFTCTVELAGMNFIGEPAKTKKQAEKNAAMAAWSSLKKLPNLGSLSQSNKDIESNEEQEKAVARVLSNFESQEENKPGRRRKVMLGYREGGSVSSLITSQYQKCSPLDLPSEISSIYTTQKHQHQVNNSNILPTTPAISPTVPIFQQPTTSTCKEQTLLKDSGSSSNVSNKISFLYSSNRHVPVQIRGKSQIKLQDIQPSLEEPRKEEDKWLNNGKSDVKGRIISTGFKPSSSCISSMRLAKTENLNLLSTDHMIQRSQFRTRPLRHSLQPMAAAAQPNNPMMLNSNQFKLHGIAPAVHIRSVIPVCAAPPIKPHSNPPTLEKEPPPPEKTEEEISSASSKLSMLQF